MPPIIRFSIIRVLNIPVTLLIITAVLYGFVMLTPPEERASLYLPTTNARLTPEQIEVLIENSIERYHLRSPYPVQYAIWVYNLARGDWGYSPTLSEEVLPALLRRTPVTAELTLYSLLFLIPLGLVSGILSGSNMNRAPDHRFRLAAFIATSLPPFILALVLLSIFYVALGWFPPERLSIANSLYIKTPAFTTYTGLITIDGLLNQRPDISVDAARHLVLPVITLSLLHWATLGRVTRTAMVEELGKDYITAGRAHGLSGRAITWRHAFRNALTPALTSSILSAAALFTGVYIVEVIYNFRGISDVVLLATQGVPDAPAVLGFAVYSVIIVLILMLALDILQAVLDPRVRKGLLNL